MPEKQVKSKQRVVDHGEVFTAEREVKAMCDLVKPETERIDSRFLEPACGEGAFLTEIFLRKLAVVKRQYGKSSADYERYAVVAITSLYGVDILKDRIYRNADGSVVNAGLNGSANILRKAFPKVFDNGFPGRHCRHPSRFPEGEGAAPASDGKQKARQQSKAPPAGA